MLPPLRAVDKLMDTVLPYSLRMQCLRPRVSRYNWQSEVPSAKTGGDGNGL
ncbi:hypothetical protein ABIB56_002315 [Glaciihabitans sp. UYNi722]